MISKLCSSYFLSFFSVNISASFFNWLRFFVGWNFILFTFLSRRAISYYILAAPIIEISRIHSFCHLFTSLNICLSFVFNMCVLVRLFAFRLDWIIFINSVFFIPMLLLFFLFYVPISFPSFISDFIIARNDSVAKITALH